jgi:hypothetical protein
VVAEVVFSNSPKPGSERAGSIEIPDSPPGGEESFLRQVLSLVLPAQPGKEECPNGPLVFQNQLGKRRQVTRAGFAKPDEFIFGGWCWGVHGRLTDIVWKPDF